MADRPKPPSRQASVHAGPNVDFTAATSIRDELVMVLAGLMEGGQADEGTCKSLDAMTQLLSRDDKKNPPTGAELAPNVDAECFDTLMTYLDMRQGAQVRGHATMTFSAYLKAAGDEGVKRLTDFFQARVRKATYDDLILAFSVATCTFPIVPDVSAQLFLSDGFVTGLGVLMRRKWKSKKVEQACLDMLNVACMHTACREAIQKYCTEWLEEIVTQAPLSIQQLKSPERAMAVEDEPMQRLLHSQTVRNLAAVILAKLQAVPQPATADQSRIQPATTTIEELSDIFSKMLTEDDDSFHQSSVEGLAYASIRPAIKEKIATDQTLLKNILSALSESESRSPTTYAGLSILLNLTTYLPSLSEEQKRITQLKAYANANKVPSAEADTMNSDSHVEARCRAVFKADAVPVLAKHAKDASPASLKLIVLILLHLSRTPDLRGRIAQQGGIKILIQSWNKFAASDNAARRTSAHALARILISTNPALVFGGNNPHPLHSAIPPLTSLLILEPTDEPRDLLPTFEALLALTNLASVSDSARDPIIRSAFPALDDLLLCNHTLVTRAAVELICNLMASPAGVAKFVGEGKVGDNRLHILLALADAEDGKTRSAAGGALAGLSEWDAAVKAILSRDRGTHLILKLCKDEDEGIRLRGVATVLNLLSAPEGLGAKCRDRLVADCAIEALKECVQKSRSQEVVELGVECLKRLVGDKALEAAKAA